MKNVRGQEVFMAGVIQGQPPVIVGCLADTDTSSLLKLSLDSMDSMNSM